MRCLIVPSAIVATLSACGESRFPVEIDHTVDVAVTRSSLTATTDNGTSLTLPRSGVYNKGEFVGALNYGNGGGMIATYRTNVATASIMMRQTESGDIAYTSVERLAVNDRPLSGAASYTGDYIGTILSDDTPYGANQVRGNLALDVDFTDQTIAGQITDRTAFLNGTTEVFILDASTINLVTTNLDRDGGFSGEARVPGVAGVGTYAGLLAGQNGSEIVGSVDLGGEIGVFAGGKD